MTVQKRNKSGFRLFYSYLEEAHLVDGLRTICVTHGVTLFEIYLDHSGPTVHAARLECWWWLIACVGKSTGEVARVFDRDRGSIAFGMKRLATEVWRQDLAGASPLEVHRAATEVAAKTSALRSRLGREVAPIGKQVIDSRRENGSGRVSEPLPPSEPIPSSKAVSRHPRRKAPSRAKPV